jgi:hypothetical protein
MAAAWRSRFELTSAGGQLPEVAAMPPAEESAPSSGAAAGTGCAIDGFETVCR